ncbi:hypothetical protein ACFT5B_12250 [Luteimicrobium sp. NPDC057192]|uniref:hypothetical protein n=1 Tax=Luteimicrobium sp. NPDC057192 TaxID=3346042 RepID=UPI003641D48E
MRPRRTLAAVGARRRGWWAGLAHGTPALYAGLLAEGTYAPRLRRSRRLAVVVAAGPPGLELWDARRETQLAGWPWASVASVRADTRDGTSAMVVETLAGAVLPLVLAAGGAGRGVADAAEVGDVVGWVRELRDAG